MMMRRVSIAVGAAAGLFVAAIAVAAFLVPADRVAAALAARAESVLEQPVGIGGVDLAILPLPGVLLTDVRVGDPADPAAEVAVVRVRPRILPLFAGRVVLGKVSLERPRIAYTIDAEGLPSLTLPVDTAPAATAPPDRDIAFAIRSLTVTDGRLVFRNEGDGTHIRLAGYDQELSLEGAVEGGSLARITLKGRVAVDSVMAEAPAALAVPIRDVRVALRHDAELDLATDILRVDDLGLELQALVLEGSGRVTGLTDDAARRVSLEFATRPFDPLDLIRSLPGVYEAVVPRGAPVPDVSGTTTLAVRVEGPASADSLPGVQGTLSLDGVAVVRDGAELLDGFRGTVAFSRDGAVTEGLRGSLFGEPFTLVFEVRDPADPGVRFAADGVVDAGRAAAFADLPEGVSADGRVAFDLSGELEPLRPATARVDGGLVLERLRVHAPTLLQPVSLPSGRVELEGRELRLRELRLAWGESGLTADATVSGWLARVLGDSALPEARFDVRGELLDLDALLPERPSRYTPILFARLREGQVEGRSAEAMAAELGMAVPPMPPVRAAGRIRADRIVRGLEYRDVDVLVEAGPDSLNITRARLGLMGGSVALGVRVRPAAGGALVSADYDLADVGAEPFFNAFTPFRDRLSGTMALEGTVSLALDSLLLPVRSSLRARGLLALAGGRLANWNVLRRIGDRLELARFDTLNFRQLRGRYRLSGPLITLDTMVLSGPGLDILAGGAIDLAGRLDVGASFRLDRDVAAGAAPPIRRLAQEAGDQGPVPVGIRIQGPVEDPAVGLDLSPARDDLARRARESAQRRLAAEARRRTESGRQAAERLLPDSVRVPPLDSLDGLSVDSLRTLFGDSLAAVLDASLRARADSLKRAAADSVASRIRRLIPPARQEP